MESPQPFLPTPPGLPREEQRPCMGPIALARFQARRGIHFVVEGFSVNRGQKVRQLAGEK
jgi:hypothetical protein